MQLQQYQIRLDAEIARQEAIRMQKLEAYLKETISSVRTTYLNQFRGRIFTFQGSKRDLEICRHYELICNHGLKPLLRGLSSHLQAERKYSTLDKRLLYALINPPPDRVSHAKPLTEKLATDGFFPQRPADRDTINVHRDIYVRAINEILSELRSST